MIKFVKISVILSVCSSISFSSFISDYGKERVVNYTKYGRFVNVNTNEYKYIIENQKGLAEAVGEGIYPNTQSVLNNPLYQRLKSEGKLNKKHWDCVDTEDPIRDFFVWATAPEDPGVKQFFIARALERAGEIEHAIKAYYAVIVHFPRTPCWAADGSFVWYVAPEALNRIKKLCHRFPDLGLKLVDAKIIIENGNDIDLSNDIVIVNPGKFIKVSKEELIKKADLSKLKIVETRGKGKVKLIKYENGHWQLLINNKPFVIKGVSYGATPVGQSPHNGTLQNWQFMDLNKNGKIDGPYDSWVDKNRNNKKDKDETIIGDFQLLKDMGCNAIRIYHTASSVEDVKNQFNKQILRDMYYKYGIYAIMGDFLGAYTIGSGADWSEGTDYTNKKQRERMKEIVKALVLEHKDEPYVLMWLLGNENMNSHNPDAVNFTNTNANKYPKEFVEFVNEVAKMIHELDPDHPVGICNLDTVNISYYAKYAPEVDIFGCNAYRGADGFGGLWEEVKLKYDRPVLITEYGCDAFCAKKNKEDEDAQSNYHRGCWLDIVFNIAGGLGVGNSIGGIIFQWMDEWWKSGAAGWDGAPFVHDTVAQYQGPFPDGWAHEEWFGIVSQGNGEHSPFLRQLRKTYFTYKDELWKGD